MAVKREEEFESVGEEDLYGGVKKGNGKETAIGRVLETKNVVGHLESTNVDESELLGLVLHQCHSNVESLRKNLLTTVSTPKRLTTFSPSPSSLISKSQNLTSLSALPLTNPLPSGRTLTLQTGPA